MTFEPAAESNRTVTAFFDSRTDAEEAIERLVAAGFSRDSIRLVPGSGASEGASARRDTQPEGFWEALKELFMPEEDRYTYAEGLRRGGYLVTVMANDANYDSALDILDDEGTIDLSERESVWRAEGWTGYGGSAEAVTSNVGTDLRAGVGSGLSGRKALTRSPEGESTEVIPVAEEQLRVGKRDVSHGRVRVRSYVVETPISEQVDLRDENVHIERRPADRAVTGDEQLFQNRTIEM